MLHGSEYISHLYNLDVIISVGYRVKSKRGILFRRLATSVLKEHLIKGYSLSSNRALVTNENYIQLINDVNKLKEDVNGIKELVDKKIFSFDEDGNLKPF